MIAPHGAFADAAPRAGGVRPDGWRLSTTAQIDAEQLAQQGQQANVAKGRAMIAMKRVAAAIGLKPGDVLLLDTLAAFSQPQDWESNASPLVWPSNTRLMEQTGFSLSALKRHLRRLANAGTIAFHDSPNGKRWGRRDRSGAIAEAYGIDLSPLAARALEFERLFDRLQQERSLIARLKREITGLRRTIRGRLTAAEGQGLRGPWARLGAIFDKALLAARPAEINHLTHVKATLARLSMVMERAWMRGCRTEQTSGDLAQTAPKLARMGSDFSPHIQTTNKLQNVIRQPVEKQPVENSGDQNCVPIAMAACPEFLCWSDSLTQKKRDMASLMRAAAQLGPMIGVHANTWHRAKQGLGDGRALAALMLVFEKHGGREVKAPDAYLSSMIAREKLGTLHLDRSLHGRLNKQAA